MSELGLGVMINTFDDDGSSGRAWKASVGKKIKTLTLNNNALIIKKDK